MSNATTTPTVYLVVLRLYQQNEVLHYSATPERAAELAGAAQAKNPRHEVSVVGKVLE
jgi:hypothetical protein